MFIKHKTITQNSLLLNAIKASENAFLAYQDTKRARALFKEYNDYEAAFVASEDEKGCYIATFEQDELKELLKVLQNYSINFGFDSRISKIINDIEIAVNSEVAL